MIFYTSYDSEGKWYDSGDDVAEWKSGTLEEFIESRRVDLLHRYYSNHTVITGITVMDNGKEVS